ncbi:substrate-binding periplasmic protein [Chromobacterium amazonense]|uniref:substrate-binding periplasmic protein n=1 Tax=Chromobacterium amazonense TaxID=1382803 RepID=UPI0031F6DFAD
MKRYLWVGMVMWLAFCSLSNAENLHFATKVTPPFAWETKGRAEGPLVDVLKAICKRGQFNCVVEVMPWHRGLTMAANGELGGAFPQTTGLPEREKLFYMTEPIVQTAYAVFGNTATHIVFHQGRDLAGHTLLVAGPSGSLATVEQTVHDLKLAGVKVQVVRNNITVLKMLAAQRYGVDTLTVMNRDDAQSLIEEYKVKNVKWLGDLKPIYYSIGLSRRKVSPDVAQRFLKITHDLLSDGSVSIILKQAGLKSTMPQ